jgi:hypothetical protein
MRASPQSTRSPTRSARCFATLVVDVGPLGLMAQAAKTTISVVCGTGGTEPAPARIGVSAVGLDPHGG